MTLDDAINDLKMKIAVMSKGAEFKVVKMSAEEARLSVYVGRGGDAAHPRRDVSAGDGFAQQGRVRYPGAGVR
jgi:hypothetical protein